MNQPILHPVMEWETSIPASASPELSTQAAQAATTPSEHVDYNHRPLMVGPLDHFDPQDDCGRFLVR